MRTKIKNSVGKIGTENFVSPETDVIYRGRQYFDQQGNFRTEYEDEWQRWEDTADREDWTDADICRALDMSEAELKERRET